MPRWLSRKVRIDRLYLVSKCHIMNTMVQDAQGWQLFLWSRDKAELKEGTLD